MVSFALARRLGAADYFYYEGESSTTTRIDGIENRQMI